MNASQAGFEYVIAHASATAYASLSNIKITEATLVPRDALSLLLNAGQIANNGL